MLQGFDGEIPDELRVRLGMLPENRGMVPEGQGEGEEVAEKRGRELLYVVLVYFSEGWLIEDRERRVNFLEVPSLQLSIEANGRDFRLTF